MEWELQAFRKRDVEEVEKDRAGRRTFKCGGKWNVLIAASAMGQAAEVSCASAIVVVYSTRMRFYFARQYGYGGVVHPR
jgi:hypothetical protein